MKKLSILFIIFSITLFAQPLKKVVLQLNWLNQFQFAGYYVAKEKGFYKDLGLDVDIKEFNLDENISETKKEKSFDFGVGRSSLIIDKTKGEDIVALAAIYQSSPLMLLTRKDSNIKSPADLRGKKIMITPGAENSASILAMIYSNKIYNKDLILQEHSFDVEDLINGKTDAMASYISNEPIIMKDRGVEYNILYPKDYGFDFYSDILFTSSEFINENPETTKRFLEASLKGWEYAFENKVETAELIYKKYNTQNKTYIQIIKEGEILKKLAFDDDLLLGCIEKNKLLEITSVFKVLGMVNKDLDVDSFVYEFNPHRTIVLEFTHYEKNIFLITLFFLFLIFVLVMILLRENKKSKDLLNTVINSTSDFIFYKDNELKYIGCNNAFADFLGKSKNMIIAHSDFDFFTKKNAEKVRNYDLECLNENKIKITEQWINTKNKDILLQIKRIPFKYSKKESNGIVVISRDITALYKVNELLKEQAYLDELTSIYNRKAYNEKLKESLGLYKRYGTTFSLLMFDIDDFKIVNDTYGHDKGDLVLKEITKTISKNIRKSDLFFRVGGEEFVIIFPKSSMNNSMFFAEKIREEVENLKIADIEKITISIGLTQVEEGDDEDSLYKRADDLLYKAKHNGKNCIFT